MILDNRQVVPDIIVSRDGVPNNSIAYNINNNLNNNQNQARGNDTTRGEGCSPRHLSKGRPYDAPKHAYVTGNNNGSPRHVPHNGNYYNEAKMSPVHQKSNKVIYKNSPVHNRVIRAKSERHLMKLDGSPQHAYYVGLPSERSQRSQKNSLENYQSPIHQRYDLQRNNIFKENDYQGKFQNFENSNLKENPPKSANFYKDYSYVSPVHQNIRNSNVKQGVYFSPKHHPNTSHLFSPKKCPYNFGKTDDSFDKEYKKRIYQNVRLRPRSSSHPCDGSSYVKSKIPVHIGKPGLKCNNRDSSTRIGAQDKDSEGNNFGSPYKTYNKRFHAPNVDPLPQKECSQDYQNQEYKRVLREYAIFSPKRVNSRLKNQNVKVNNSEQEFKPAVFPSVDKWEYNNTPKLKRREVYEEKFYNSDSAEWNTDSNNLTSLDSNSSWNIEHSDRSEEENDYFSKKSNKEYKSRCRLMSWPSLASAKGSFSDEESGNRGFMKYSGDSNDISSDKDSAIETDGAFGSKIVLIKCKDANYLTRIFVNNEGIHGLRVVGRIGVGGSAQGHVMSLDQPVAPPPGDPNSNHSVCSDDVSRGGSDVTGRDVLSETAVSLISQTTDTEFEHEAADYQWLLDYDMPIPRYRESYSKDSHRDGSTRVSVLQPSTDETHLSYETLSRNIDANLAEIDMDDFRSEDIHQLLSLPNICTDLQDGNEDDIYSSVSGSMIDQSEMLRSPQHLNRCLHLQQQERLHQKLLKHNQQHQQQYQMQQQPQEENCNDIDHSNPDQQCIQAFEGEHDEEIEEEYSGVSGDVSLYQSGPLFSPLKEPPHIPPSFSVDSLDSDSIHEDLILTCQANKNNYTIAFEGSFVQYSDSDYQEPAESDGTGSGTWSTERLEGRSPAPNMTFSDQPYTTWSRVSRRSSQSRTPESSQTQASRHSDQSPVATEKVQQQAQLSRVEPQQHENKSNSMPNLMRRSLMRRSLETSGHCIKVYDLQNSLRSSQLSSTRSVDANNFSLMRLFIKQKSLSKEAVSLSSSCTDPSQEGACSSSENHSGVNDSSDWPMNSQSENDMEGSASPVPITALNNHIVHERSYRGRINTSNIMMAANQDSQTNSTEKSTTANITAEVILNNNNLTQMVDNVNSNPIDNITSFEDSLKEINPCSKPPMTSPIREEPEGMDISLDSRCENKVFIDQSEKEKSREVLRLKDNNCCNLEHNKSASKSRSREINNKNMQGNKNALNTLSDKKKRSESPGATKPVITKESLNASQRKRQDSGNSSSGYISNKGSTERIRRSSESDRLITLTDKPKPKPRSLRQFTDQCLQTSNLKVSATVNTSGLADKKEVYVYYPNYALPDLGFLKEKKYSVDARIFLVPQHYTHFIQDQKNKRDSKSSRPFSCGDMEKLKKHGFSHVKDWESLNFLLPKELKEMLLDDTECMETIKPSFCRPSRLVRRPVSVDSAQHKMAQEVKESKGSSTSLSSNQPSSGYRGSSTMLNDSDEGANTLDHRYVYRYDNTSMESDSGPPIPRRSVSLAVEDHQVNDRNNLGINDTPPPRPPLPRGILRKCTSLRDDTSKSSGSKRHSAGEVTSKGNVRDDILKRRSLQEPINSDPVESSETTDDSDDKNNLMGCSCVNECTGFCAKGLRKKNLLLVDELPEVSSHEELTESDLVRLRSQVSDFLASKGNSVGVGAILTGDFNYGSTCDCPRKNVSFAGRNCAHRQNASSSNTINISKKGQKEIPDPKVQKKPTSDEDLPPMLYDAHDKKTLVLSVRSAVEKLVMHFNKGTSQQEKNKLGMSLQTPEVAQMALDKLCPAIYALLSDGLLPSLHSLFGKISNSVWRVVEATSQIGPSTKALNDLVLTLNSEDCLSEGPIKFNAFIFGLLNIRSLDAWLGYLRTRESALQKHYHPESFLYLSNTATRALYDDLLLSLRPLAILPFRLDLLHEYKALHASLLKMEERLAVHTSHSPTDMPIDILLAAKESKEFRNAAARTTDRSRSPRPRSCHENAGLENVQGALRKRWSGVQLGSKLVTAIDKLLTEEAGGTSSEDYSDSLDTPKKSRANITHQHHDITDDAVTDMRLSDLSSRDGDLSERSATDKDTDTEKGLRLNTKIFDKENESEGERFRRLQLKWEAMTGHNNYSQKTGTQEEEQEKERNEMITSPAGIQRSRIPRPVSITSPQQVFKPFEASREKTSPQYKQTKKLPSLKDHPKPAPRRSLKDRVVPTDLQDMQNIRGGPSVRSRISPKISSGTNVNSIGSNRASSVPGRKLERGSSGSRYESQKKSNMHRSASQGRRRAHAEEIRLVQTLHHRLATDNGHLSFSRGDILTVIVEVDERFLLCCLHDRKGLVPRSSVVSYQQ